jgi:hypothetical protein
VYLSPTSTARLEQHAIAMGMRMCPLSMTPVPKLFFPNYTLRQTIATYNREEDWDEIALWMCPLSMTPVTQVLTINYTLRQTIDEYLLKKDTWDELAMFALCSRSAIQDWFRTQISRAPEGLPSGLLQSSRAHASCSRAPLEPRFARRRRVPGRSPGCQARQLAQAGWNPQALNQFEPSSFFMNLSFHH